MRALLSGAAAWPPALWLAILPAACLAQGPPLRHEILVTGAWEPIPLEEADRAVRSLPVRSQLLTHSVWTDFLAYDPSLDLRSRAPFGVQADLSIRGATFGQTLVLLDGMRLNDPQTGHHNLDVPLPLETVSRIEVLRGAGSTLYGADAVGGAVHLVTRVPERHELRLRGAAGNHGLQDQRIYLAGVRGNWSQQLAASRQFSSGFMPNRDFRNLSLASITRREHPRAGTAVTLAHNDRPFGAERFYGPFPSWERTRTWYGAIHQRLPNTNLAVAWRRHTDLFVLYRERPEIYTNRHRSETWQASLRRRHSLVASSTLHYGVEYLRDGIRSTNLGLHSRTRGAAYAAWDARALRRFSFTAGARQETYRAGASPFAPTLSGGVWIHRRLKLRGAAARAFRLPTFTDLYYRDPATRGSPDLRPESAWSFESGLDVYAERVQLGLTAFERRERDGIDYVRRPGESFWQAANLHRLRMRGWELDLRADLGRGHQLALAWTALSGWRKALGDLESRYVFNYPSQAAVASWHAVIGQGLAARLRLGSYKRTGRSIYFVADGALAWERGWLRPFVGLQNMTNTRYEEIAGVPMPGRSVLAGVEILLGKP